MKTFEQLYAELGEKAATRPEGSGTVAALDAGVHGIGKKIVEEAAEVWMAAEYESHDRTAEEISQLLYHLQVLMHARGIALADAATGAHSPALVSQGRIGAVIAAKPGDRRQLLEEAAGIAGLHVRRRDAEQKLRATEANLTRLDEVIAEGITHLIVPTDKTVTSTRLELELETPKHRLYRVR